MTTQTEALKLVLKTLEQYQVKRQDFERFADVITDIKKTLAQPKEQEPVAWISQKSGFISHNKPDPSFDPLPLYTTPPQRKPQFKEFVEWANGAGYDTALTYDTERSKWLLLSPMSADLWKAWQAAHGIKE